MDMDMLERSLTADDEAMDMPERYYLTADDEAMDMDERSLTFPIDNGVVQAADGFLTWLLDQLISGQQNLEEEEEEDDEAAEFFDRTSDDGGEEDDDDDDDDDDDEDDEMAYQSDPEFAGYPTEETVQGNYLSDVVTMLNFLAQQLDLDLYTVLHYFFGAAHSDGGAGLLDRVVVPASDAAVAGLEKQAFHRGVEGRDSECGVVTGCAICLEDFDDGEEVTVMPCSRRHEFHPECITEWLGKNKTCPLCRHALPTDVVDGDM